MPVHTLHLCYFGVREPLVQTQVIPYLEELAKDNTRVSILTFEPQLRNGKDSEEIAQIKTRLKSKGIDWHFLVYHKRPTLPATLLDVFNGVRFIRKYIKENNVNVLHARSHVAAMMGGLTKKLGYSHIPLIFDIRGFFPEEYVDGGVWKKNGMLYKLVKKAESWLLKVADGFVVLTEKARDIMFEGSTATGRDKQGRPIEVIPCCVDWERFEVVTGSSRAEMRKKLGIEEKTVVVYTGALGGWYLADEMADFLKVFREQDPSLYVIFLTQSSPDLIVPKLRERGFAESDYFVGKVPTTEVPLYLCASDLALSFIRASYSKLSTSPTKLAEYLAIGLPVVCSPNIGDVDEMITNQKIGTLLTGFTKKHYLEAISEIETLRAEGDLAARCRQTAKSKFDLYSVGGVKYKRLYRKLLNPVE